MATPPSPRTDPGTAVVVRILGGIALVLLALVLLAMLALAALNTDPGRGFVARQLESIAPESGLKIDVGRLEGSLYGRLIIHDLRVSDPKGVFATSPAVVLDWHPTALVQRHVLVNEVTAETVRLLRLPAFNETTTEGPILPDIDITVGRLAVNRLVLEPPVAGRRHLLTLTGRANIADRRAIVLADARAAAGDRINLRLDAVPDDDRFDIDATLAAPAGGVVTGLAGLKQSLTARIDGNGSWSAWHGTIQAQLGGTPLADLRLEGRDGRFVLRGQSRPGLLLSGAPSRLLSPAIDLNGTATLAERRVDVDLHAVSAALDVTVRGLVDLGQSRFGGLGIEARLLRPSALLDDTRGRDVLLVLALDGPFATPVVDYRLTAAALGFGETGVETFRAEGRTRLERAGPVRIPVTASAARVVGVNEAVGGVLRNLRVNGTLQVTPQQLVSDNLRLRSDRLDATAVLAVTFATGRYDLALKGTINRYELTGLGVVDLTTDARLVPTATGEMGVRGNVQARVRRLDNAGLRSLLGGLPTISATFERDPNGSIRFANARLASPKLRIDDARGLYRANGTVVVDARGRSTDYGPFTIHAEGPANRPAVRLRASHPNVGVQLTNVEAVLTPNAGGYVIRANGGSPLGPVTARARLALGGGPLAVDIDSLQVAGLTARGRVTQTTAGPYSGRLAINGSGLSGTVQLAAAGAIQRIDAQLRANQARLALEEPLLIAQGEASATALLYPNAPAVDGRAAVRGLRWGELALTQASGQGNYRGGRGTARISAAGRSGVPFALTADAGFTPDRIRVGAQGNVNRLDMRLAQPAEILSVRDGWQLLPATVLLGSGRAEIAGTFARDTRMTARLINIDLGVTRAFSPELRLGGRVGGNVQFTLPARGGPSARVGLTVLNLTRSSLAGTSRPIDFGVNAALSPAGGDVRALLRRGTAVVGRLQARLAPLPGSPDDPVVQRLLAAPLVGNFRYDGPAEALWTLSGVTGHEVRGPLAITAEFGGRISDLRLSGTARAQGLRYDNLTFGTAVKNIALDSRFSGERFDLLSLTGTTGNDGRISAKGSAVLSADRGFPANIEARFDNARLARRPDLSATVSGPVRLTSGPEGALLAGDLSIDSARYSPSHDTGAADIPTIAVRRVPQPGAVPARPPSTKATPPSVVRLQLNARANNNIRVEGMGLESEWQTRLRIGGTADAPRIVGPVELVRGTFSFAGNRFDLTRGFIRFNGSIPANPTLDIAAETQAADLTVILQISGTSDQPQIAFTSTPALPQEEVMARLLFGSSVAELSAMQALQLASSVASLQGGGGGLNPLGKLRQATGLDRFRILGSDKNEGRGTALAVGEYLSDDIYVELTTDVRGYTATQIEIALTRALSLVTQVGGSGGTNVSVRYGKDY